MAADLLAIQRSHGNRAVVNLLSAASATVQRQDGDAPAQQQIDRSVAGMSPASIVRVWQGVTNPEGRARLERALAERLSGILPIYFDATRNAFVQAGAPPDLVAFVDQHATRVGPPPVPPDVLSAGSGGGVGLSRDEQRLALAGLPVESPTTRSLRSLRSAGPIGTLVGMPTLIASGGIRHSSDISATMAAAGPGDAALDAMASGGMAGRSAPRGVARPGQLTPVAEPLAPAGSAPRAARPAGSEIGRPPAPDVGRAPTLRDFGRAPTLPDIGRAGTLPMINPGAALPPGAPAIGRAPTLPDIGRAGTLPMINPGAALSTPAGGAAPPVRPPRNAIAMAAVPAGAQAGSAPPPGWWASTNQAVPSARSSRNAIAMASVPANVEAGSTPPPGWWASTNQAVPPGAAVGPPTRATLPGLGAGGSRSTMTGLGTPPPTTPPIRPTAPGIGVGGGRQTLAGVGESGPTATTGNRAAAAPPDHPLRANVGMPNVQLEQWITALWYRGEAEAVEQILRGRGLDPVEFLREMNIDPSVPVPPRTGR